MNGKLPYPGAHVHAQRITDGEWQQGGGACACHTVSGSEAGLTGDCPPPLQGGAGHQPDGWCHQLADMARLRCVERRFDGMRQCPGSQRHIWLVSSSTVYHPACNAHIHTVFGSVPIKVHTAIALLHATVQACMSARACCNAHACLPESAVRAHCRRHCPGRWITANHPVYHPLGSQGQENVPTECGGGDTSVRFLLFHSVHRMHAFLAPTAQTALGGNRCRATKSDF